MQATSTLVIYDLRDPEAWEKARMDRAAWGKHRTPIHGLDPNHIILEFRSGEEPEAPHE